MVCSTAYVPASAQLIELVANTIPPSDVWCILYPSVRRLLEDDVRDLDALSILNSLRRPVCSPFLF